MIIIVGLHCAIALMYRILNKYRDQINSKEFEQKFGTLIEGVNSGRVGGLYWNVTVLLRWSSTIIILVCLRNIPEY